MKIILDSTPLIYLNKVDLSWVFKEFETFISHSVFEEVVIKGKELSKTDAIIAEKLIKERQVFVEQPKSMFKIESIEIGDAERQTIALAKEKNAIAIIDDEIARQIGELFEVEVHGTFFLIIWLVKRKKLNKKQAMEKIQEMIDCGWRIGVEKYLLFAKLINEL